MADNSGKETTDEELSPMEWACVASMAYETQSTLTPEAWEKLGKKIKNEPGFREKLIDALKEIDPEYDSIFGLNTL